jgi:hypothetical protein
MIGLIVLRLYRFEVGHIQVHLWQSLYRLYFEEEDQTNHYISSAQPNETQETHSLVYHQSINSDLLASYLSSFNLSILFVEECNKFRSIMTAVAFRRKNKPGMRSANG